MISTWLQKLENCFSTVDQNEGMAQKQSYIKTHVNTVLTDYFNEEREFSDNLGRSSERLNYAFFQLIQFRLNTIINVPDRQDLNFLKAPDIKSYGISTSCDKTTQDVLNENIGGYLVKLFKKCPLIPPSLEEKKLSDIFKLIELPIQIGKTENLTIREQKDKIKQLVGERGEKLTDLLQHTSPDKKIVTEITGIIRILALDTKAYSGVFKPSEGSLKYLRACLDSEGNIKEYSSDKSSTYKDGIIKPLENYSPKKSLQWAKLQANSIFPPVKESSQPVSAVAFQSEM